MQPVGIAVFGVGVFLIRAAFPIGRVHDPALAARSGSPRLRRGLIAGGAISIIVGAAIAILGEPEAAVGTASVLSFAVAVVLLRPLLLLRFYERRVSLRTAVWGSAALFAVPFLLVGVVPVLVGSRPADSLPLWIAISAVMFVIWAAGADLLLRFLADDRPPSRDHPQ